jgi:cob(I)alamin adenosyltransferase
MSIATRTGDAGTTALMFGRRVSKCDARVQAYGSVDELNAALGLARAMAVDPWVGSWVEPIQRDLVVLMGELATHPDDLQRYLKSGYGQLTGDFVARLDARVKLLESGGVEYRGWATPGATPASAALDVARTACRRAERQVCALHEAGLLGNAEIIVYLNRFSDLLWLMARQVESGRAPVQHDQPVPPGAGSAR